MFENRAIDPCKGMKCPTMIYKYPGPHQLDDGGYDYIVVDAPDVEKKLKEGWSRTPQEAKKASKK